MWQSHTTENGSIALVLVCPTRITHFGTKCVFVMVLYTSRASVGEPFDQFSLLLATLVEVIFLALSS